MKVDFLHNPFFPIFAFGFETKKSKFQDIKEKKRYASCCKRKPRKFQLRHC